MGYLLKKKKKTTIPKHILKKPSTLIRFIKNNKNSPKESRERERERERERVLTVLCGKKIDWMEKWYQIYKIKWVEEESKYKKEEWSITVK